ncbi:S41 family peptidase [Pontibacter locisalis]|uniref:S41 family peptidase n=1 Tax=Pontibacter locisalis TaxID=1719035 RepID=A0ABW5ILE2_9BACT
MKKPFILFTLLLLCSTSFAQKPVIKDSVRFYLDTVLTVMSQQSLYKHKVDWQKLRHDLHQQTASAKSVQELKPAFTSIFTTLNDQHSAIYYKKMQVSILDPMALLPQDEQSKQLTERVMKGEFKLRSEVLEGKYGYILIPQMNMPQDKIQAYAEKVRQKLCELNPGTLDGWIIDLRVNTGGNMYPMATGIGPLVGEGIVGGAVDADKKQTATWRIINTNFAYDDWKPTDLPKDCDVKKNVKVAVLIGPHTASSGETMAVMFKGRPNTRFFGQPSMGLTTSNAWLQLTDDFVLNVSTSYFADRNKKAYTGKVNPDVAVDGPVNFENLNQDAAVTAALKWLKK